MEGAAEPSRRRVPAFVVPPPGYLEEPNSPQTFKRPGPLFKKDVLDTGKRDRRIVRVFRGDSLIYGEAGHGIYRSNPEVHRLR